jgi:Fe-S cluster assembly iron-binding protein IscA
MLTVTQTASERLSRKLTDAEVEDDTAVRVVRKRKGRGWAMRMDKERPSDVTFAHQGRTVLVLDEEVSQMLANKTLDVRQSDSGPKLSLR